jgi:hypothetical protein
MIDICFEFTGSYECCKKTSTSCTKYDCAEFELRGEGYLRWGGSFRPDFTGKGRDRNKINPKTGQKNKKGGPRTNDNTGGNAGGAVGAGAEGNPNCEDGATGEICVFARGEVGIGWFGASAECKICVDTSGKVDKKCDGDFGFGSYDAGARVDVGAQGKIKGVGCLAQSAAQASP